MVVFTADFMPGNGVVVALNAGTAELMEELLKVVLIDLWWDLH